MLLSLLLCSCLIYINGIDLLHLEASNFDLVLASSKYAAVLFYDKSATGVDLIKNWENASILINELHDDATMAKIDGTDSELKELIDAYGISVPSIRVFRRSIMGDYRGPSSGGNAKEIADYIMEDAMVSYFSFTIILN